VKNISPNRSFGLLLATACAILGVLSYRAGRATDAVWATLAVIFLLTVMVVPRVLAPVRRGWLKIGHWLGVVMNPVVLGAVYAGMFIPIGGLMRLFRRDPMARGSDPAAKSYWINRKVEIGTADSLREQF
jgi:hypothetical protein